MSGPVYHVLIYPDTDGGWCWGIYDSPQHRGVDRIAMGETSTRWGAKRAVSKEVKRMERRGRRRELSYEIEGRAEAPEETP